MRNRYIACLRASLMKAAGAWVHADQAEARRAIGVPLNEDAVVVFRGQLGKNLRRVFVGHDGKPEFGISAGMIFGTRGRAGTCS
jgi:hypothetical protein